MSNRTKRATQEHVIGKQAVQILESILPPWWVMREYKPDYGIDLAIKLFEEVKSNSRKKAYDTLGEHLFVQVKGAQRLSPREMHIPPRINVERGSDPGGGRLSGQARVVPVLSCRIDANELLTSQRMGAALPIVLVVVEVSSRRAFFVCLTDYVDKIILPNDPSYATKQTKTILVPISNEIKRDYLIPLQYYAKRPKLYAAFQKFAYQEHELKFIGEDELLATTRRFARILLRSDVWKSCEWWAPIAMAHRHLECLVKDGDPQLFRYSEPSNKLESRERIWSPLGSDGVSLYSQAEMMRLIEIRTLWQQLANLGRIHEEVCREWFLPSFFGTMTQ
ncbi:MAG: DUF4365 domain-containing protein [Acidobacteriia bacterium]|nr:DUF4365 domain-containing protein [Terriglobia bacterium]